MSESFLCAIPQETESHYCTRFKSCGDAPDIECLTQYELFLQI